MTASASYNTDLEAPSLLSASYLNLFLVRDVCPCLETFLEGGSVTFPTQPFFLGRSKVLL